MSREAAKATPVRRRCGGRRDCRAVGTVITEPIACIGRPTFALIGTCKVCGLFVCGSCAGRTLRRTAATFGAPTPGAVWLLTCPKCGEPLGAQGEQPMVSSHRLGSLGRLALPGAEFQPRADLATAARIHRGLAYARLYAVPTSRSLDHSLMLAEAATVEAPWEDIGWLYKAQLCQRAGHTIAAHHAMVELHKCPPSGPEKLSAKPILRRRTERALAANLRRRGGLTGRIGELDRAARGFDAGDISLLAWIALLYGETAPHPRPVARLLETVAGMVGRDELLADLIKGRVTGPGASPKAVRLHHEINAALHGFLAGQGVDMTAVHQAVWERCDSLLAEAPAMQHDRDLISAGQRLLLCTRLVRFLGRPNDLLLLIRII